MNEVTIRPYHESDLPDMIRIWNQVVEDGMAFPQEEGLDEKSGAEFFAGQYSAVAESNIHARHLYERLGFVDLGVIPGGFKNKDGVYEDIHVMYHVL